MSHNQVRRKNNKENDNKTSLSLSLFSHLVWSVFCVAFAWLKCEEGIVDCERFLREEKKIITKNGKYFGDDRSYVRISMLDRDSIFNIFLKRITSSSSST